jgi:plasmid stabilization system protein ParE
MATVELLPAARLDFDQSFDWYAARSQQAASRYIDALDAAFTQIAADPDRFPRIDQIHRRCLVRRFPFRVIFRVVEQRIVVIAVAHLKREPDYWRRRTK